MFLLASVESFVATNHFIAAGDGCVARYGSKCIDATFAKEDAKFREVELDGVDVRMSWEFPCA